MSETPDVVVVTYNSAEHIGACIDSFRADGFGRIIVVDNASADATAAIARAAGEGVEILETGANLGFAAAVNRGMALASSDYVAVANPDVVVCPGARKALSDLLDAHPDVGAVGPRIETVDGDVYPSVRRFPDLLTAVGHAALGFVRPDNRFSRRYRMTDWSHDQPAVVDWISGTFMLLRRDRFVAIGGFDEQYFMYVEDVDLCWRLRQAGDRVAFEPAARVIHTIGGSSEHTPYRMIVEHHRSLYRFAAGTATGWRRALLPVLGAGMAGRVGASWLQRAVRRRPPAAP